MVLLGIVILSGTASCFCSFSLCFCAVFAGVLSLETFLVPVLCDLGLLGF